MILDQLNGFIKQNYGKSIEAEDPSNLYQCMDAAFAWCDFLKIPRETIRHLHAFEVYAYPSVVTRQYFDLIPNGPTNSPEAGSLVVFDKTVGLSGHICIATGWGDSWSFLSFDQNWIGKQVLWPVDHNYRGVMGWLRPKNA